MSKKPESTSSNNDYIPNVRLVTSNTPLDPGPRPLMSVVRRQPPKIPACLCCHAALVQPRILSCGHSFCNMCITRRLEQLQPQDLFLCPKCSTPVDKNAIYVNHDLQDALRFIEENTAFDEAPTPMTRCGRCSQFIPTNQHFCCRTCTAFGKPLVTGCAWCIFTYHPTHILVPVRLLASIESREFQVSATKVALEGMEDSVKGFRTICQAAGMSKKSIHDVIERFKMLWNNSLTSLRGDGTIATSNLSNIRCKLERSLNVYRWFFHDLPKEKENLGKFIDHWYNVVQCHLSAALIQLPAMVPASGPTACCPFAGRIGGRGPGSRKCPCNKNPFNSSSNETMRIHQMHASSTALNFR